MAAFRSNAEAKRRVVAAVELVAKQLGNTKAVCRKCYIHPAILEAYQNGMTMSAASRRRLHSSRCSGLSADEEAVVQLIEQQMKSA
jgi:DNA topoisomerase-1